MYTRFFKSDTIIFFQIKNYTFNMIGYIYSVFFIKTNVIVYRLFFHNSNNKICYHFTLKKLFRSKICWILIRKIHFHRTLLRWDNYRLIFTSTLKNLQILLFLAPNNHFSYFHRNFATIHYYLMKTFRKFPVLKVVFGTNSNLNSLKEFSFII